MIIRYSNWFSNFTIIAKNKISMIWMQIIIMQSVFYLTLSWLVYVLSSISGWYTHSGHIFSKEAFSISHGSKITWLAYIIMTPIMTIITVFVVERSIKVLDYILTLFFYHFLLCWLLYGFPNSLSWYVGNLIIFTSLILASEQAWLKQELQEIKFDMSHLDKKEIKK